MADERLETLIRQFEENPCDTEKALETIHQAKRSRMVSEVLFRIKAIATEKVRRELAEVLFPNIKHSSTYAQLVEKTSELGFSGLELMLPFVKIIFEKQDSFSYKPVRFLSKMRSIEVNYMLNEQPYLPSISALKQLKNLTVHHSWLHLFRDFKTIEEIFVNYAQNSSLEDLGAISGLKKVSVANVNEVNQLGASNMAILASIETLERLSIGSYGVSHEAAQHFSDFTSLQELSFYCNLLTDDCLEEVSRAPQLKRLFIEGNPITGEGFESWQENKNFEHLQLSQNQLTSQGLTVICRKFGNTQRLLIGQDKLDEIFLPAHLEFLNGVEYLHISKISSSQEMFAAFNHLQSVKEFIIGIDKPTPKFMDGLATMPELESLNLCFFELDEHFLDGLKKLKKLKKLSLQRTIVPQELREVYKKELPGVTVI